MLTRGTRWAILCYISSSILACNWPTSRKDDGVALKAYSLASLTAGIVSLEPSSVPSIVGEGSVSAPEDASLLAMTRCQLPILMEMVAVGCGLVGDCSLMMGHDHFAQERTLVHHDLLRVTRVSTKAI